MQNRRLLYRVFSVKAALVVAFWEQTSESSISVGKHSTSMIFGTVEHQTELRDKPDNPKAFIGGPIKWYSAIHILKVTVHGIYMFLFAFMCYRNRSVHLCNLRIGLVAVWLVPV